MSVRRPDGTTMRLSASNVMSSAATTRSFGNRTVPLITMCLATINVCAAAAAAACVEYQFGRNRSVDVVNEFEAVGRQDGSRPDRPDQDQSQRHAGADQRPLERTEQLPVARPRMRWKNQPAFFTSARSRAQMRKTRRATVRARTYSVGTSSTRTERAGSS